MGTLSRWGQTTRVAHVASVTGVLFFQQFRPLIRLRNLYLGGDGHDILGYHLSYINAVNGHSVYGTEFEPQSFQVIRIPPCMVVARKNCLSWVCLEEGSSDCCDREGGDRVTYLPRNCFRGSDYSGTKLYVQRGDAHDSDARFPVRSFAIMGRAFREFRVNVSAGLDPETA